MPAPYSNNNIDPRFEFPRENLEFTDVLFDGKQTVIYKATARGIKDEKCIDVAVKAIKGEEWDWLHYLAIQNTGIELVSKCSDEWEHVILLHFTELSTCSNDVAPVCMHSLDFLLCE